MICRMYELRRLYPVLMYQESDTRCFKFCFVSDCGVKTNKRQETTRLTVSFSCSAANSKLDSIDQWNGLQKIVAL